MRKIKFRGKSKESNEWVYGYYVAECGSHGILVDTSKVDGLTRRLWVEVDPETVGQFTGLIDCNYVEIYEKDTVIFNNSKGEVVYESGSFGIGFDECIDYDAMLKEIHLTTGCENSLGSCCNDNFISLWEIYWNYNCEDNSIIVIEVIGNIHDNKELLEESL